MLAARTFSRTVFINCPFDAAYEPLLEATVFCSVFLGFEPLLATIRLDNGENRLDKIISFMRKAKFSIHDLSRCKADAAGEYFRMNMPFEYGLDLALRKTGGKRMAGKRFLVFEETQYELKKALSDIAGQDVEHHNCSYETIIKKVRDFLKNEGDVDAPGARRIVDCYATFQGWMVEKKIAEGHTEEEALHLPTKERITEMKNWMVHGQPEAFSTS